MTATVVAVSRAGRHVMTKSNQVAIRLIVGLGVEGDAHSGKTVKHRSRVKSDPNQPNLRQVHIVHQELFDELRTQGFQVQPGLIGENITTRGLDLLGLPTGTHLILGPNARVEITGLRKPCYQLDGIQQGLMAATLARDANNRLLRKAGVMGIVLASGVVSPGDTIELEYPSQPHQPLEPV